MGERYAEFTGSGARIVGISVDSIEDSGRLTAKRALPFPLLTDPDMTVIKAWGVAMVGDEIAVPAVFVVNRRGQVTWQAIGESSIDRPSIDAILAAVRAAGAKAQPSSF